MGFKPGYCAECQNTGYVECYCGGDLCVCGEQELPCPVCGEESGFVPETDDEDQERGYAEDY